MVLINLKTTGTKECLEFLFHTKYLKKTKYRADLTNEASKTIIVSLLCPDALIAPKVQVHDQ